ncbi:MAG TPA: hypothetical protein GX530_01180 [Corynebacteriales bacterium]|nr:hypothetical protein [Mycobacteriales bacterium]
MAVRAAGTFPGENFAEALNVIVGEFEPHLFYPTLSNRGPAASATAQVSALFDEIHWSSGLRTLEMHMRTSHFSHSIEDTWKRDWDTFLASLDDHHVGEGPLMVCFPGPYAIASTVELPNGHWAVTDPGAVRHLVSELSGAVDRLSALIKKETQRTPIVVLDESAAGATFAGQQKGAHKFEEIPPPNPELVVEQWESIAQAGSYSGGDDNCLIVRFPASHCDWTTYSTALDSVLVSQEKLRVSLNVEGFSQWPTRAIDCLGERLDAWGRALELSAIAGGAVATVAERAHSLALTLQQLGVSPHVGAIPGLHSTRDLSAKTVSDAQLHLRELGQYPEIIVNEWNAN